MRTLATWILSTPIVLFLLLTARSSDDPRDNWPHWRGPLDTGAAVKGNPPLKWDEKTNVRWKVAIPGKGSSTPIVWDDRVFITTAVDTERKAKPADIPKVKPPGQVKTQPPDTYYQFIVMCLDRHTGKVRWQRVATEEVPHEGMQATHSYAAGSPVTDGKHIYASFGSHGIYCYNMAGKLQWKKRLGIMFTRYGWGEASTPALYKDWLIINWDHEGQSYIFALDARTGNVRWKKKRDEPTSWATPLIVEYKGKVQVVVNGTNRVRSYDLKTGDVLWQCGGQTINAIPSPVAKGGVVYCMSGYRGSTAHALPLDASGDLTKTKKILWQIGKGTPYIPSPLLMGNRLYFLAKNFPVLSCVNAETGKVIYQERLPGLVTLYASPMGVQNRIYISDRDGTTMVIQGGDNFKILAVNRLDAPIDGSPAIAGDQMFLRAHHHVYCLQK